jgi:hypothetical protein
MTKGYPKCVNRTTEDNTMTKRKTTKCQTMNYKTLHKKRLRNTNRIKRGIVVKTCPPEGWAVLDLLVTPACHAYVRRGQLAL